MWGDILKPIKSILVIVCVALMALSSGNLAYGNPYSLYGEGNCVKFTVDCMERFWPMVPDIPGEWDAHQWTGIVGQEKAGYQLKQVAEAQPGDIFVLPQTTEYPRGHVGMIIGVFWGYSVEAGSYGVIYQAIDSDMYATANDFPLILNGCRYRERVYTDTELLDAVFIRCTKGGYP